MTKRDKTNNGERPLSYACKHWAAQLEKPGEDLTFTAARSNIKIISDEQFAQTLADGKLPHHRDMIRDNFFGASLSSNTAFCGPCMAAVEEARKNLSPELKADLNRMRKPGTTDLKDPLNDVPVVQPVEQVSK